MSAEYETVIGLEVHCQLGTHSKAFCSCPAAPPAGISVSQVRPNDTVCSVCTGQPGALPVLNQAVVTCAIQAGLALHCEVQQLSRFARKHYFYPDLPKGYQITQADQPICTNGWLEIESKKGRKKIRVQRIHIEEDAGKNTHEESYSFINLNRAGVPLLEIVSQPDLSTPEEAGAYLRELHAIIRALGISDGNLQEGNFRCDANVSVRPRGSSTLGVRTEIKNVNSFRFIEKAIEFETARHIEILKQQGTIYCETRGYDSARNRTFSMRSKEEAQDYRYAPEPDLPPLVVDAATIESVRVKMPELPDARRQRYQEQFQLATADVRVLCSQLEISEYFEEGAHSLPPKDVKSFTNLMTGEVARLVNEGGESWTSIKVRPSHLVTLAKLIQEGAVSVTAAKTLIQTLHAEGGDILDWMDKLGLRQVSDQASLEKMIQEVIQQFPLQVEQYKSGKVKLLGFLVGQAMKLSKGQGNPAKLQALMQEALKA